MKALTAVFVLYVCTLMGPVAAAPAPLPVASPVAAPKPQWVYPSAYAYLPSYYTSSYYTAPYYTYGYAYASPYVYY